MKTLAVVGAITTPYLVLILGIAITETNTVPSLEIISKIFGIIGNIAAVAGILFAARAYQNWKKQFKFQFTWEQDQRFRRELEKYKNKLYCLLDARARLMFALLNYKLVHQDEVSDVEIHTKEMEELISECISDYFFKLEDFQYQKPAKMRRTTKEALPKLLKPITAIKDRVNEGHPQSILDEIEEAFKALHEIDMTLTQMD
jgi:hypothetical protein